MEATEETGKLLWRQEPTEYQLSNNGRELGHISRHRHPSCLRTFDQNAFPI